MPDEASTNSSDSSPPPTYDLLRWLGSHSSVAFYPSHPPIDFPQAFSNPDTLVWQLCREGYLEVCDWAKGMGQGFRLTAEGEALLHGMPNQGTKAETVDLSPPSPEVVSDTGAVARERLLHPPAPFITPVIMVAQIVWFVVGGVIAYRVGGLVEYLLGNSDPVLSWILPRLGALSGGSILSNEWWRFLTFGFVHVGLFHLLAHLVILALLGIFAEGVWGRWRFLTIYILSGLIGAMLSLTIEPQAREVGATADVLLAGASGSIWGITIATLAWLVRNLALVPKPVALAWIHKILIVAIMNIMVSFYPHINLWCIIGGGISGFVIALSLARIRGRWRESLLAATLLAVFIVVPMSLLSWATRHTVDWKELKLRYQQLHKTKTVSNPAPVATDTPAPPP
jgi:rhomboid protease GluP